MNVTNYSQFILQFTRLSRFCRGRLTSYPVITSQTFTTTANKPEENTFYSQSKKTHFGFDRVSEEEKFKKVTEVFSNVADNYDVMNDAMSFGVHRLWKDHFVGVLNPTPGIRLLDVAGGTGDIAFRFLKYVQTQGDGPIKPFSNSEWVAEGKGVGHTGSAPGVGGAEFKEDDTGSSNDKRTHVTVCDINQSMLDVGQKRAEKSGINEGISWLCGNAEDLPVADNSYDVYTIAFGIRNVVRIENALKEAHRVLKPGGRFLCLEFSKVENPLLAWVYKQYSFQAIPVMGQVIAQDWKSYQYLVESIEQFPSQERYKKMIKDAGFKLVTYNNLTFGVVAIHSGFKL